ncbi:MAG: hypothetical protein LBU16_05500, partial [Treponema sp.]|nr:hypothetical protein [Treponema sp.]
MSDLYAGPRGESATYTHTDEYTASLRQGILERQERARRLRDEYGIQVTMAEAGQLAADLDAGKITPDGVVNYYTSRLISENLGKQGIAIDSQYVLEHLPEFQRLMVQDEEALKTPKTALKAVQDGFVISGATTRKAIQGLQLMMARWGGSQEEADILERQRKEEDKVIEEYSDYQKRGVPWEIAKIVTQSSTYVLAGAVGGPLALGNIAIGATYGDLHDAGVEDQYAIPIAIGGGALKAAIENKLGSVMSHIADASGAKSVARTVSDEVFRRLRVNQTFLKVAGGPIIRYFTGAAGETLEEAGEEITSILTLEIANALQKEGVTLPENRSLVGYAREVARAGLGGFMGGLGFEVIGLAIDQVGTIANYADMRNKADTSPTLEAFVESTKGSPLRGDKTDAEWAEEQRKIYEGRKERRDREEARLTEEYRRTRLYSGEDQSEGTAYRDEEGRLYTENIRHAESNGVTTGTYQGGNPTKTEANTYWKITYEMEGDRAVIDQVRVAGNYETLKPEILQGFANDLNQDVTWEGTTYTPQDGAVQSLHIGWNETKVRQSQKAAAEPARANTEGLSTLTRTEQQFFDRLKTAMPQVTDLQGRAVLEQFKVGADLQNLSFEEYLNRNFQEGVFAETDANELAAAQQA